MSWLGRFFNKNNPSVNPLRAHPKKRPNISQTESSQPQSKRSAQSLESVPDQIELELRHFLHRIPPEFLNQGEPDLSRLLKFKTSEIMTLIAQGKIMIPVSVIAGQMPDLFSVKISAENDVQVFFPWQRVADLIAISESQRSRVTQTTPIYEPIFANRVVGQVQPEATKVLPPPHLREAGDARPTEQEQRRAALNARKQAWFSGSTGAAQPEIKGESPEASNALLHEEIESLRAELIKTRKERDEALAALGLPIPPPATIG